MKRFQTSLGFCIAAGSFLANGFLPTYKFQQGDATLYLDSRLYSGYLNSLDDNQDPNPDEIMNAVDSNLVSMASASSTLSPAPSGSGTTSYLDSIPPKKSAGGAGMTSYVDSMGSSVSDLVRESQDHIVQSEEPEIIEDQEMQALFLDTSVHGITSPNPSLDALQVATLCMNAMRDQKPESSLELCFEFSSDRCRAAVGGSLEEFVAYAANPVFGKLVHCSGYEVKSIGPIIAGSATRGEMQTILIEIKKALTVNDAISTFVKEKKGRRPIAERIREQEARDRGEIIEPSPADIPPSSTNSKSSNRFLWTLQKERRPPRQNCWLVHEVLFVKNAFELTE
jgi:hypothetical protein